MAIHMNIVLPVRESVRAARDRCRRSCIRYPELQSPAKLREYAARNDAGESQAKIAAEIGCSESPLQYALQRWRERNTRVQEIGTTARERARQRRAA